MARIQHIAISCKENEALAEFYKKTFGLHEVGRHTPEGREGVEAIFLSDGYLNLAVLPNSGRSPEGIAHFGVVVDDVAAASASGVANGATPGSAALPRDGRYAEAYIVDPNGTRVDLSDKGWEV